MPAYKDINVTGMLRKQNIYANKMIVSGTVHVDNIDCRGKCDISGTILAKNIVSVAGLLELSGMITCETLKANKIDFLGLIHARRIFVLANGGKKPSIKGTGMLDTTYIETDIFDVTFSTSDSKSNIIIPIVKCKKFKASVKSDKGVRPNVIIKKLIIPNKSNIDIDDHIKIGKCVRA